MSDNVSLGKFFTLCKGTSGHPLELYKDEFLPLSFSHR